VCAVTDLSAAEYDMILSADVICKLKAMSASCADVSVVSGEGSETPKVVTEGGTPEEVDESVADVKVCVTECDVNGENVVKLDDIVTSTPACVSCTVASDCGEETEIIRFHPEPCLESIPPLEKSRDRFGDYTGRRDEEVRRIQEMADLEPRRTRSHGKQDQDVFAGKSKVGTAIRGPRGSGRVRPSDSPTTSPVARIVLVMLWQILYLARAGTLLPIGIAYVILGTIGQSFHPVRRGTAFSVEISCDISVLTDSWTYIMFLYDLLYTDCIYSYICNIVQGQITIFATVSVTIFLYVSTLSPILSV